MDDQKSKQNKNTMEGTLSALGNKYRVRFSLVEKNPPVGSEPLEVYLATLESDQDVFGAAMYEAACVCAHRHGDGFVFPCSYAQEWTGTQKFDAYRVNLMNAWGSFARYFAFHDKQRVLMESSPHAYISLVHRPIPTMLRIQTIFREKEQAFLAVLKIDATAVGVWNCGKCQAGLYQRDGTFVCTGCQTGSGWAFERVFDAYREGEITFPSPVSWKSFSDEFKLHGKPRSFPNKWQCAACSHDNEIDRDTCLACGHGI